MANAEIRSDKLSEIKHAEADGQGASAEQIAWLIAEVERSSGAAPPEAADRPEQEGQMPNVSTEQHAAMADEAARRRVSAARWRLFQAIADAVESGRAPDDEGVNPVVDAVNDLVALLRAREAPPEPSPEAWKAAERAEPDLFAMFRKLLTRAIRAAYAVDFRGGTPSEPPDKCQRYKAALRRLEHAIGGHEVEILAAVEHAREVLRAPAPTSEPPDLEGALQNVKLYVIRAKHRGTINEEDAGHLLRFCTEAGCGPNPLRAPTSEEPTACEAMNTRDFVAGCKCTYCKANTDALRAPAPTSEPPKWLRDLVEDTTAHCVSADSPEREAQEIDRATGIIWKAVGAPTSEEPTQ